MDQFGTEHFPIPMQPEETFERVRRSWAMAAVDPTVTARIFYSNLFKLDPDSRKLFPESIEKQGKKLAETLNVIVDTLDNPDVLLPAARDLAIRHVSYGVEKYQYDRVGSALVETLKELLGSDFDARDEEAWVQTYTFLSNVMTEAAYAE